MLTVSIIANRSNCYSTSCGFCKAIPIGGSHEDEQVARPLPFILLPATKPKCVGVLTPNVVSRGFPRRFQSPKGTSHDAQTQSKEENANGNNCFDPAHA